MRFVRNGKLGGMDGGSDESNPNVCELLAAFRAKVESGDIESDFTEVELAAAFEPDPVDDSGF